MTTLRNAWRQLTSMRTALVLLFLLALASIPGSVLPQRTLGPEKVNAYLAEHRDVGPWFDTFQLFNVYSSVWFSAIYLLLFVSLVGCVVPRLRTHVGALVRIPPEVPSRLDRLPVHTEGVTRVADPEAAARTLRALLRKRRFRTVVRPDRGAGSGGFTVSAEKGYLKETGNLLFHFALLGLLIGMAAGGWYGWHGNRIVVSGEEHGFCNSLQQYDEYELGARLDAADLPRFCVSLTDFTASYLDNGQPESYEARVRYENDGRAGKARGAGERRVAVNHPLRLDGANLYLLGHGYAPVIRYTDRAGRQQTVVVPFLPRDSFLTSDGVAAFPDANVGLTGPDGGKAQVAFSGVYLPTLPEDVSANRSAFPAERDPRLMLRAYLGDLGMDAGIPQSVYEINLRQIENGQLRQVGDPIMLRPGESFRLPDNSTVEFLGTRPWISVAVRHDPGERVVLVSAILLVLGLLASLAGRRRRIFFRVTAEDASVVEPSGFTVSAGGLPRSEYTGFAAEFERIVRDARGALPPPVREEVDAHG